MSPPPRILLVRPDRLGDLVVTTAVFASLAAALPGSVRFLAAQESWCGILQPPPDLDGLLGLPPLSTPSRCRQLTGQLRTLQLDIVIHLETDPDLVAAAADAAVPRRIGWQPRDRRLRTHLTEVLPDHRMDCERHESEYAAALIEAATGVSVTPGLPSIPGELLRREIPRPLRPFYPDSRGILVHPGAHGAKPSIPAAALARSIDEIRTTALPGAPVIIVGRGRRDRTAAAEFRHCLTRLTPEADCVDLTDRTTPEALAAVCAQSALFLGRDSGPAHIAAAVGCPTVAVVGPLGRRDAVRRWKPLGACVATVQPEVRPRFWETTQRYQNRFFRTVSPQALADCAIRLLRTRPRPG